MAKLQLFPNLTNSHSGIPPAMLCHHHCPVAALPQDLRLHTTKPRSRRRNIVQHRTSALPLKTTKFKSNQMSKITRSATLNNLPDPLVPNLLSTTSPSPRGRTILVAKIKAFYHIWRWVRRLLSRPVAPQSAVDSSQSHFVTCLRILGFYLCLFWGEVDPQTRREVSTYVVDATVHCCASEWLSGR